MPVKNKWDLISQIFIRKASCRKAGDGWERKGHGAGGRVANG